MRREGIREPGDGGRLGAQPDETRAAGDPRFPGLREAEAESERLLRAEAMERERGGARPVWAEPSMSYEDALKKTRRGELARAVLTERGWVVPGEMLGDA